MDNLMREAEKPFARAEAMGPRLIVAEEKFPAPLMPPAPAPDDGESTGDLTPDDDTDCCAAEGITQPEPPPVSEDVLTWRVGVVMRLRRLEQALEDVNDHLQVHRNALAESEREARKAKQAHENEVAALRQEIADLTSWYHNLSYRVPA